MLPSGSGMSDSNLHISTNVPTLLPADTSFGITDNRFIQTAERTPLANLQLTVLDRYGLPLERFDDSTGELPMLAGV